MFFFIYLYTNGAQSLSIGDTKILWLYMTIMSDWLLFKAKINNFRDKSWREQVIFQCDDDNDNDDGGGADVRFVLDQHV
jgi:hypothetical protein